MAGPNPVEPFRLEILSQRWSVGDYDDAYDTCSHGTIRATIDGTIVTDVEAEYGISQSARELLGSLDGRPPDGVAPEFLLCHACGYPFSAGCSNFGTSWTVERVADDVIIRNVRHYDALKGGKTYDLETRLPYRSYATEIVRFAETAKAFYFAAKPRLVFDAEELPFHLAWWREFDDRLERATRDIERR
jgi:hypothetical protein